MAKRLLDAEEAFDEKDPVFIARLSNGNDFVATFVNYADALKEYPENILGGAKDRTDGHNKNTSVVFTYPSKEYFDEGRFVPVSIRK